METGRETRLGSREIRSAKSIVSPFLVIEREINEKEIKKKMLQLILHFIPAANTDGPFTSCADFRFQK